MPTRTFGTAEVCPNCKVNIYQELCNHVYSEGGRDFEFECPSCGHSLEITVEPVPAFSISAIMATQHSYAADGGYCPRCKMNSIYDGCCIECGVPAATANN